MDLIARDRRLSAHGSNRARLLAAPVRAHGFHSHLITCLAWRPDGQVLAVGHADGSVTLFGAEEGEQFGMTAEHAESLSTFCCASQPGEHASGAAKADASTSASAKDSPYACSLAGLFARCPCCPSRARRSSTCSSIGTLQRDIALYCCSSRRTRRSRSTLR